MKAVYWARNDLRIDDNPLFEEFFHSDSKKLVVIVPDQSLFRRAKEHRRSFAMSQMSCFRKKLDFIGIDSVTLWGDSLKVLTELRKIWPFDVLYFAKNLGLDESLEERIARDCFEGIEVRTRDSQNLLDRHAVHDISLLNPRTYTEFRKLTEPLIPKHFKLKGIHDFRSEVGSSSLVDPYEMQQLKINFPSDDVEYSPHWSGDGYERLYAITRDKRSLLTYANTRNGMIHFDDSSKLSPWLSLGSISPQVIWNEVSRLEDQDGMNESTICFKRELIWREYFRFLFQKLGGSFFSKPQDVTAPPEEQIGLLEAWKRGETSSRFVNAHMRELAETGWMSNRGRQNVASFLSKELKVDWRLGASYFEECLIDYDPFNNWGNWGYLAGVGTDPRNRKFDVELQASKYDPHGDYQRLWLGD